MYHILPFLIEQLQSLSAFTLTPVLTDACLRKEPLGNSTLAGATELTLTDTYFEAHQSRSAALIIH